MCIRDSEKGVELKFDIEDATNVFSDPNAFLTIVRNLIDNAIKYTPAGGLVLLKAKKQETKVLLQITDSGIGMTEFQVANIFELRKNKSKKGTNGEAGTGIGLSLVKELIAMNKGIVNVFSEQQKGTTFEILFPAN